MRKIKSICLALAVLMAITLFAGCGDTSDKTSDTSTPTQSQAGGDVFDMPGLAGDPQNGDNTAAVSGTSSKKNNNATTSKTSSGVAELNENTSKFPGRATDLKGKTITVHAWNKYMLGNDSSQPKLSQKAAELTQKIEKTYNCKLKYYYSSAAEPHDDPQLKAAVASGKPKTDIWWLNVTAALEAYASDFLVELDSLKVMDFTDTTRYTNATDMLAVGGKHYGIGPRTYGIMPVFTNFVMFANTTLLNDIGVSISELSTLQSGKQWNWENFEKIAKKVKDNAAAKGYKTYAVNDYSGQFYQALMNSNGTDWISRAADGSMTFTGGDAKGQKVLKYYSSLVQNGYVSLDNVYHLEQFAKGDLAFIISPMFTPIYHGDGWKFEYTFMYPPMGEDMDKYTTASSSYSFAVIPKGMKPSGCTDAEIATILDAINTTLIGNSEDASLASVEMAKYMKNNLAKDTIMTIYKNKESTIVWPIMTQNLKLYSDWPAKVRSIANAGGGNMSSVLGSVTDAYNQQLKDLWKR